MSNPDAPSDRLRERAAQNRFKLWFLLSADRWAVTGSLAVLVFAVLTLAGLAVPGAAHALRRADSVDTLFQGLLTATITGVTLVLTLNQLVLSQELGAVGDQRERMEDAMAFRSDVADVVGAPTGPARPAQFLRALVETAADRARALEAAADAEDDAVEDRAVEAVDDLVSSLLGNAEEVSAGLDGARFGAFDVISSALDFNYSWKLYTARRIAGRHADALSEETLAALEDLIEVLELFGPAREHFKTLYFQWELIDLSKRILLAAVPALLVAAGMLAFFDPKAFGLTVSGVDALIVVVATATTLSLVPFFVLLASVMRVATVTKHTLSIGPFILRETDGVAEVEWDR